jgi:hypothetical protein
MLGFKFRETMSGSYHLDATPDRERAISFTAAARVHDLPRFLRDRMAEIEGEVVMEGFAEHRPMRGTLEIDPVLGRKLVYEFDFEGDDGKKYRFAGRKTVEVLRPLETMTTLPAEVFDDAGKRVAEAVVRFDARSDLVKFLKSWRLAT